MKNSNIEWTHHTFNPWRGCTKVSPGCQNCYAEALSKRNPATLGVWGDSGTRVLASEAYWKEPLKWDREAKAAGERRRVFCASLADVFEDRPEMRLWRERLWALIRRCPDLDWLLLTKRPEGFKTMLPWSKAGSAVEHEGVVWPHVWLGVSVEDQQRADERIPHLLSTPAAVRFLSCEPLLGPVDLKFKGPWDPPGYCRAERINWVIVGGESGPQARPCGVEWMRGVLRQCQAARVACFVKQLGSRPLVTSNDDLGQFRNVVGRKNNYGPVEKGEEPVVRLKDRKGGDIEEFPVDLRVREFPNGR